MQVEECVYDSALLILLEKKHEPGEAGDEEVLVLHSGVFSCSCSLAAVRAFVEQLL